MAYENPQTMSDLREYVTGKSGMQQADSTVAVQVTHSHLKARFPEIRLDMHMSIEAVKHKLHTHTGTAVSTMVLQLKDESGQLVALLTDDCRPLGFYSPRNGWMIHVTDTDQHSLSATGWLEDTSKVEKYMISDEDYAKRDNTYRKYKEEQLKKDPSWTLEKEMCIRAGREYVAPTEVGEDHMQAEASGMSAGQRCSVEPGDRRGEVKYVGQVEGLAAGYWVGVQYDEPLGKNDGSIKGKRYWQGKPGFGAFVRPDKVTVGDFPPADDFSDLESGDEI